jgi:GDP/UDP-N,N'-diacetylbacillosamine 2-epimerase (hydrolysing)
MTSPSALEKVGEVMKKLRVCVVTGTRAEFGIWRPVLAAIQASRKLDLQLVVTGMHLLRAFGHTVKDIEASAFPIAARVPMYRGNEPPAASLARGIAGLAAAFRKLNPGLVMVLGDRLEMLAAASAALAQRLPIAHLHGGETAPGTWDEQIRHALTKMAHLHFCATKTAARRILRMGEDPARVHVVGAPALDDIVAFLRCTSRTISHLRLVAGTNPLLLLHPSSADDALECRRALMLIDVLRDTFANPPVIHALGPNNDPGHRGILQAYAQRRDTIHLEMSLPQQTFWFRLLTSGLLVGNSSSGILEAASFGIPVVNIGDRQAGRQRNPNVIDVDWNPAAIARALRRPFTDKAFARRVARRQNLYGDGHAAPRLVAVLEQVAQKGVPLEKRFAE